jgi:hypothetical protein
MIKQPNLVGVAKVTGQHAVLAKKARLLIFLQKVGPISDGSAALSMSRHCLRIWKELVISNSEEGACWKNPFLPLVFLHLGQPEVLKGCLVLVSRLTGR